MRLKIVQKCLNDETKAHFNRELFDIHRGVPSFD